MKEQVKEESEEDPEVNEVAKEIMNILEGEKEMNNKDGEKVLVESDKVVEESSKETANSVVVTKATVEQANLKPPVENKATRQSKFQKLSVTLRGANGTYRVCENGVEISNVDSIISFKNEAAVDQWANEVKEAFAELKA